MAVCLTSYLRDFWIRSVLPGSGIANAGGLLFDPSTWSEVLTSLEEVLGGIVFGGLFAIALSSGMNQSPVMAMMAMKILPALALSPFVLWILALYVIFPAGANPDWQLFRTFFMGVGHKIMGVGFVTLLSLMQGLWVVRETPWWQRWLNAVDGALPIAFVAMCFGELYAATAGLAFNMVVAGATMKYQQALAWFLITLTLLVALSTRVRFAIAQCERRTSD